MIRKTAAFALALVLALTGACTAFADSSVYSSLLLNGVTLDTVTFILSDDYRTLIAASVLLDYMLSSSSAPSDFAGTLDAMRSVKIKADGSILDVYFPLSAGGYRNVYVMMGSGSALGVDFGYSYAGPTDSSYYSVTMIQVLAMSVTLLEQLNK